jgi:hypothetical protein
MQVENCEYLRMLKEKLPIFLINTLLLHIPLLALTHRQNYGETDRITEEQISPGWAGTTSQRTSWAFLAGKISKICSPRHHRSENPDALKWFRS